MPALWYRTGVNPLGFVYYVEPMSGSSDPEICTDRLSANAEWIIEWGTTNFSELVRDVTGDSATLVGTDAVFTTGAVNDDDLTWVFNGQNNLTYLYGLEIRDSQGQLYDLRFSSPYQISTTTAWVLIPASLYTTWASSRLLCLPEVEISVSDTQLIMGEYTTVSWSATGATTVEVRSHNILSLGAAGALISSNHSGSRRWRLISIAGTLEFSITATNAGGTSRATVRATWVAIVEPTTDSQWSSMVAIPQLNRPPVLQDPPDVTVGVGASQIISLQASDPDGDDITFTASRSTTRFSFSINNSAESITVTGNSSGAGTLTITPRDEHGLVGVAQSVAITVLAIVVNQPPVLSNPGNVSVEVNNTRTLSLFASDPDGDDITFTGVRSNSNFSASFDNANSEVDITGNVVGSGTLRITPRDEHGLAGTSRTITVTVTARPNRPPVWDLPAAFNVRISRSITFDLLDYSSDPDNDALSFTASESSAFFSISRSGSQLTVTGGSSDRRPAGNISLTVNDGTVTVTDSVPVNILDLSQNTPPIVLPPVPTAPVVLDGAGRNRVLAGAQFVATDSDGDRVRAWDVSPPNGWREDSAGSLSSSTVPNAHQTGFVQISAEEDYFGRFTIYQRSNEPSAMTWRARGRVRCRDVRQAWSNYEDYYVDVIQAVHGDNLLIDTFQEEPDRRQPNIWAFKKEATSSFRAGGVHYQYATPEEAKADRDNWVGSISYNARELWNLVRGSRPPSSVVLVRSLRSIHPSLDGTLDGNIITFTAKAIAESREPGAYTSAYSWEVLAVIDVQNDDDLQYYPHQVTGFVFITGEDTTDSEWSSMVSMSYVNQPPVCSSLPNRNVIVGSFINVDLSSYLSDPEGDDITIAVLENDASISITGLSASNHSFIVNAISAGTSVVTVTPTDEHGLAGTPCTFTVTVVASNRPPVCSPLPDRSVQVGLSRTLDLSSYLSDPDGDDITIAVTENDANISITGLNASTHRFTVNGLSAGTAVVTVTPTDENGLAGSPCTFTVTVSASNLPPECSSLPDREVLVGNSITVDLTAYLSDPDNDSITIAASENDANISITGLNPSAHRFVINGLSAGSAVVTVTPTDEHGLAGSSCTFTVTVTAPNRPPTCSSLPSRRVTVDRAVSVDLSSYLNDPDNDDITIQVSESSSRISITGLNASAHSFSINGLSVGTATVTVTPIDEHGLSGSSCTFTVTVAQRRNVDVRMYDIEPNSDRIPGGQTVTLFMDAFNLESGDRVRITEDGSVVATVSYNGDSPREHRFTRSYYNRTSVFRAVATDSQRSVLDEDETTVTWLGSSVRIAVNIYTPPARRFDWYTEYNRHDQRSFENPLGAGVVAYGSWYWYNGFDGITVRTELYRDGRRYSNTVETSRSFTGGSISGDGDFDVLIWPAYASERAETHTWRVRMTQTDVGVIYDRTFTVEWTDLPRPPVCSSLPNRSIRVGEALAVDLSSYLSDPDGDAVTITATTTGSDITVSQVNAEEHTFTITGVTPGDSVVTVVPTDDTGLTGVACTFTVAVVADSEWSDMVYIIPFNNPPECDEVDQVMAIGETRQVPLNIRDVDGHQVTVRNVFVAGLGGQTSSLLTGVYSETTGNLELQAFAGAELGTSPREGLWFILLQLQDELGLRANCSFNVQVLPEAFLGRVYVENLLGRIYVQNMVGIVPVEVPIAVIPVEVLVGEVLIEYQVSRIQVEVLIGRVEIAVIWRIPVEALISRIPVAVLLSRIAVEVFIGRLTPYDFRWTTGTTNLQIRYDHDLWWQPGDLIDASLSEAESGVPPYTYSIRAVNVASQGSILTDYGDALLPDGVALDPAVEVVGEVLTDISTGAKTYPAPDPHRLVGTVGSRRRGQYVFIQRCDDARGQFIIRIYRLFVTRGVV